MTITIITRLLLPALMLGFLAACDELSDPPTTYEGVAARVNGEAITLQQINAALSKLDLGTHANSQRVSAQVLDTLVAQQLAAQKALELEVDRDLPVSRALERSERRILAESYLRKVVASIPKPGKDEIKGYFNKHPELFEKHRTYSLRMLTFEGSVFSLVPQAKLNGSASFDEIARWLTSQRIVHKQEFSVMAAGEVPIALLKAIYKLKKGQMAIVNDRHESKIIELVDSLEQPINEAEATPMIERFLMNERYRTLAEAEINKLRASASVEYMGEFAKPTSPEENSLITKVSEEVAPRSAVGANLHN